MKPKCGMRIRKGEGEERGGEGKEGDERGEGRGGREHSRPVTASHYCVVLVEEKMSSKFAFPPS